MSLAKGTFPQGSWFPSNTWFIWLHPAPNVHTLNGISTNSVIFVGLTVGETHRLAAHELLHNKLQHDNDDIQSTFIDTLPLNCLCKLQHTPLTEIALKYTATNALAELIFHDKYTRNQHLLGTVLRPMANFRPCGNPEKLVWAVTLGQQQWKQVCVQPRQVSCQHNTASVCCCVPCFSPVCCWVADAVDKHLLPTWHSSADPLHAAAAVKWWDRQMDGTRAFRRSTPQGGNVTFDGWQVTLCDPMWHVSSHSGVATLRTAIKKVKFSHTRYRALGPELILVYMQSARRWREVNHVIDPAVGCRYFLSGLRLPP